MSSLFTTPVPRRPRAGAAAGDEAAAWVPDRPARVGVVGSGFRARAFLRVMDALPAWFECVGVAARNAADRELLSGHGFRAVETAGELLAAGCDFVVDTLPPSASVSIIGQAADAVVPVLTETPAAANVAVLSALADRVAIGACVHVAEQYHLEPLVAAQLAVAASGRLGRVTDAHVNLAHDYHGISVLRRALAVGFEPPVITARRDARRVAPSPSRYDDPAEQTPVETIHAMAWLEFPGGGDAGSRLGVYEFDDVQYRSWVRSPSLVLRGEAGEVRDDAVRTVAPDGQPVLSRLERMAAGGAGSHEGLFLRGYRLDGEWASASRFRPARLADEELSIAEQLAQMAEHVLSGGPAPYSFAEGAQDQYLQLLVREAAETGQSVRAAEQRWAVTPPSC
ncbi:Gfo/Idh/MocA family oxidoreductase [Zhihengliuella flava]|uniref:Dehydrogenase n=1 Tax=Zhihengliuella flava TaxID=1285193 RepID=A0A931D8X2_9MICC|nr:Gfo/Idh/MocA family oxidoreductase [Zhihengliuella flava]MBG6084592.1 putative dehydrogenase [Zhihengliuella flava]